MLSCSHVFVLKSRLWVYDRKKTLEKLGFQVIGYRNFTKVKELQVEVMNVNAVEPVCMSYRWSLPV